MDPDRDNAEDINSDEGRQTDADPGGYEPEVLVPDSPEPEFFRQRRYESTIPDDAQNIIREMNEEKRKKTYTFIYGVLTGCLIFMVAFTIANFIYSRKAQQRILATGDSKGG